MALDHKQIRYSVSELECLIENCDFDEIRNLIINTKCRFTEHCCDLELFANSERRDIVENSDFIDKIVDRFGNSIIVFIVRYGNVYAVNYLLSKGHVSHQSKDFTAVFSNVNLWNWYERSVSKQLYDEVFRFIMYYDFDKVVWHLSNEMLHNKLILNWLQTIIAEIDYYLNKKDKANLDMRDYSFDDWDKDGLDKLYKVIEGSIIKLFVFKFNNGQTSYIDFENVMPSIGVYSYHKEESYERVSRIVIDKLIGNYLDETNYNLRIRELSLLFLNVRKQVILKADDESRIEKKLESYLNEEEKKDAHWRGDIRNQQDARAIIDLYTNEETTKVRKTCSIHKWNQMGYNNKAENEFDEFFAKYGMMGLLTLIRWQFFDDMSLLFKKNYADELFKFLNLEGDYEHTIYMRDLFKHEVTKRDIYTKDLMSVAEFEERYVEEVFLR